MTNSEIVPVIKLFVTESVEVYASAASPVSTLSLF